MTHYVYKTFHPQTGEFYIGSRSSKVDPTEDKYMGSGFWVMFHFDKKSLKKEIISIHETREQANDAENLLVRENFGKGLCRNMHLAKARSSWKRGGSPQCS